MSMPLLNSSKPLFLHLKHLTTVNCTLEAFQALCLLVPQCSAWIEHQSIGGWLWIKKINVFFHTSRQSTTLQEINVSRNMCCHHRHSQDQCQLHDQKISKDDSNDQWRPPASGEIENLTLQDARGVCTNGSGCILFWSHQLIFLPAAKEPSLLWAVILIHWVKMWSMMPCCLLIAWCSILCKPLTCNSCKSLLHCAESCMPFELFVNENCKLRMN